MGLFDNMVGGMLSSVLSQAGNSEGLGNLLKSAMNGPMAGAITQALPGLLDQALAKTPYGNLEGLLAQLNASGLGEQVSSWLSSGPNAPVSAEQIVGALGETQLGQMAAGLGLSADTLPNLLSEYLPTLIDKLSPEGVLKDPAA